MGDWKLVSESECSGQWELSNLKRDRIESKNLAASHPAQAPQMSAVRQQTDEEFRRQTGAAKVDK
jgi:hypothetical protein